MGRHRVPTATLRLRGSFRADRHGDTMEVSAGTPDPPPWLQGIALEEWVRVSQLLSAAGVLTPQDRTTLAIYCQSYADYITARAVVEVDGPTFTTPQGCLMPNPACSRMAKAWEQLLKAGSAFGLTPSSRASIRPAAKTGANVASRFFKKLTS